ncbi:hypothetical protein B0E53_06984 [Micromonospora sp. MH33]|nr:hypothetical protein B0E53_06984 [Micromonospora sp. MH33]
MPAGGAALRDQPVHPEVGRGRRLGRVGHGDQHPAAGPAQVPDHRLRRQAEREADHRHRVGEQQVELRRPVVVVLGARGGRQVQAVGRALGGDPGRVAAELRLRHRHRGGHEDVHPERPATGPQVGDLRRHRLRCLVAGGQERERPGHAHRRRQPGGGRPTAHRRRDDRHVHPEQLPCPVHGSSLPAQRRSSPPGPHLHPAGSTEPGRRARVASPVPGRVAAAVRQDGSRSRSQVGSGFTTASSRSTTVGTVSSPPVTARTAAAPSGSRQMFTQYARRARRPRRSRSRRQ